MIWKVQVKTPDGKFGSSLIGATLKIKSPKVDPVKFPTDKFIIPDEFETRIKSVKNDTTMVPIDDFLVTDKTTNEQVRGNIIRTYRWKWYIRSYDVLFTFSYSIIEYNTL